MFMVQIWVLDMSSQNFIKISLKKFSKNIQLKIVGTGKEIRSFIYIDDFLNGFISF